MIKKIMSSLHPSIEKFIDILLDKKFNQRDAKAMLPKINKNYKFENGDSLIDLCLSEGKFKAASWLVNQGVELSNKNRDNVSTVRLAIQKGDIVIIDDIMNNCNININQVDNNGRSLLQDAVIFGYNDIVKKLIDFNIDVNIKDSQNRNVIFDSVNYGDPQIIDTVLEQKQLELNNIDINGKTVLHQKIVLDNDDIALKLLEKGADPTICDKNGMNYLTYTALKGIAGKEMLNKAITLGCNLNAKNQNETTVLSEVLTAFSRTPKMEIERRAGLKEVAQDLIDGGSDVNVLDKNNESVIFNFIRKNDFEGVRFILGNDIDTNLKNKDGDTPLMLACIKGIKALDIILLLLEYGADPMVKNKKMQTIPEILNEILLHVYRFVPIKDNKLLELMDFDGKYLVILKEILSLKDYDFKILDSQGNPLFFKPFLYGDTTVANLYLQQGFNINQLNENKHNLFYEYVLKAFEIAEDLREFTTKLTYLLVNKADIRIKNSHGQTIYLKVSTLKKFNMRLFKKLIELTKFDQKSTDNMGRTVIHNCIMVDNMELFNYMYVLDRELHNKADNYSILPVTYAALMGKNQFVYELLKNDCILNSGKPISEVIRKKFRPMLKNLTLLHKDTDDKTLLKKIEMLKEQILRDFK